ncbi:ATP-binding protein, partial [Halobacteriales archaeon QS_3_64_16]
MEVTLLGAGDTTGTPTIGCSCDTCKRARERGVERSRFSVHVRNEHTGESVLIDASPDLRYQFLTQEVDLPNAAVISHIHFDHLDGLGNAYRLLDELPVYAANERDPKTGESVAETVERKYDYLEALTIHPTEPFEAVEVCGLS